MDDEATPISYMAVTQGTPVLNPDGQQLGTVERVLDDESLDLFDGITVNTDDGLRFVDADVVTEITDRYVRTSLPSVEDLPEPSGPAVLRPNEDAREKDSFFERARDALGHQRSRWEREKDE